MKSVLVAMSGGVDSAVAALLLRQSGWDCRGVTMRLVRGSDLELESHRSCCSSEDALDAADVCAQLGIEHETVDFSALFRYRVISRFCSEYERGRTPNPCIDCNRFLKFEALLDYALDTGCDAIATGHYARVTRSGTGRWELRRARDARKDQSYVLTMLSQEQLGRLELPLGELTKEDCRKLAAQAGLVVANKPDSQDICFLPGGDYGAFWERWTGRQLERGAILDENGRVLGAVSAGAACGRDELAFDHPAGGRDPRSGLRTLSRSLRGLSGDAAAWQSGKGRVRRAAAGADAGADAGAVRRRAGAGRRDHCGGFIGLERASSSATESVCAQNMQNETKSGAAAWFAAAPDAAYRSESFTSGCGRGRRSPRRRCRGDCPGSRRRQRRSRTGTERPRP